jgi:rifampicin phosphotransferase
MEVAISWEYRDDYALKINSLTKTNYFDKVNQIVRNLFSALYSILEKPMSKLSQLDGQTQLVVSLARFGRSDLALAGGKGANLGELLQVGFEVPPGFVITTSAYDLFLQTNGLQTHISDMLSLFKAEDPASVSQVSQRIRERIQHAPMPKQIIDEVLKMYHTLGGGAVAVRSSATAEDLPGATFAGQQETFLNIVDEAALINAVRGCWASLWSERAMSYRARQNVDQTTVKLAVVIQQMVPADIAGVMFTANPISGARSELVIDASPGLGEAVVAGLVTPDHFVINKRSLRLKEERRGRREVSIRAKAGGGVEQIISSPEDQTAPSLSKRALRKLAGLGAAIESHYGTPQDIEWAWQKDSGKTGQFFILQARPMTALPRPLKVNAAMKRVMPMLAEMWLVRPYPLDMTTFTGALERAIGNLLVLMIGKSAPNPDEAFLEEDGVVVHFDPPQVRPSPGMLISPWLALWRTGKYDPSKWTQDKLLAETIAHTRELEARNLRELSWAQNIETLHELLALIPRFLQLRERYVPQSLLGLGGLWILLTLSGRSQHFGALLAGVETKTTETNRALERLASEVNSDPALLNLFSITSVDQLETALKESNAGHDFLERFTAFMMEYGHREIALTISQGTWRDEPQIVMGILKVLAVSPPQETDSYDAWKRTRDELLEHSIHGTRLIRPLFLKLLTRARCFFQIREDTHFYATLPQPAIRRVALELGRRLHQADALASADDVFHLRLEELEALGEPWPLSKETCAEIRALAARRQAKRESLASTPMVDPRYLITESQATSGEDFLLSGTPGSAGIASGPARIVHNASEFEKLQPGDILVAPVTNPAWTPLFLHAAAVVVDTGGPASHAAIVAREYGIPAVMGTIHGTQLLTDGQWIQVDGIRGLVFKGEIRK